MHQQSPSWSLRSRPTSWANRRCARPIFSKSGVSWNSPATPGSSSSTALAGYGALFTRRHTFVDIYVHPDAWNRGVGSHLLELVETEARRRGIGLLRNGVIDNDERARALLHARGYRIVRHFYRMAIELNAPPPATEWPEGLRVSVYDSREARAFHAALEEAFEDEWDHEPESFDDWRRRRLEAPNVDPSLWFAVKEGDEIAATAVCDRERYGMGWVG